MAYYNCVAKPHFPSLFRKDAEICGYKRTKCKTKKEKLIMKKILSLVLVIAMMASLVVFAAPAASPQRWQAGR